MKDCNSCGKCCIKYSNGGLSASKSEIALWDVFKPEVMPYVKNGEIWVDPDSGKPLELCPWLEKLPNQKQYSCAIYYDRPDDCKFYPTTLEEMVRDECEMLEERDLKNTKIAQKTLDRLMTDSRPPCY